jgi:hypothetical protein
LKELKKVCEKTKAKTNLRRGCRAPPLALCTRRYFGTTIYAIYTPKAIAYTQGRVGEVNNHSVSKQGAELNAPLGRLSMSTRSKRGAILKGSVAPMLFVAISLASSGANAACTGPGAPSDTQTKCLTAVQIPGNPLRSFDISWVNPTRSEYYLADRSNAGIDIINTNTLTFQRTIGGFVGVKLNAAGTAVNNNISGPDGVTSHGRWLYAGDGDSTLKVIDLSPSSAKNPIKQSISTGGTTRVDEMALTTDGKLLLAANNAEDPPFATLFRANGDAPTSSTAILSKVVVSNAIVPAGAGLSIEQPAWEPTTARFYVSIPIIANNPPGCNFSGPITCDGGLLVVNPATLTAGTNTIGAFDPTTNTGVVPLHRCGPNGATVGPHENLLLGCTPQNNPSNTETLVINAENKNQTLVGNITGSDEVWFNEGDNRYYTGSSRACGTPNTCPDAGPPAFPGFASLGVIDFTSVLIEKIPQSSNSHSVAADSKRNLIFVPQVAPKAVVGSGGDITPVGAGICGSNSGCVAVYKSGAPQGNGNNQVD